MRTKHATKPHQTYASTKTLYAILWHLAPETPVPIWNKSKETKQNAPYAMRQSIDCTPNSKHVSHKRSRTVSRDVYYQALEPFLSSLDCAAFRRRASSFRRFFSAHSRLAALERSAACCLADFAASSRSRFSRSRLILKLLSWMRTSLPLARWFTTSSTDTELRFPDVLLADSDVPRLASSGGSMNDTRPRRPAALPIVSAADEKFTGPADACLTFDVVSAGGF